MVRAAGPTVVIRSRWSVALAVAMVATAVIGIAMAAGAGADALRMYAAPLLLFALLGWAAFWRPHVEVSDGGVRITNTWRSVHVPWPAITEVDGRYGLRLHTSYGTVTSWAAPAPTGRARARSQVSEAAWAVTARLAELRTAGYLDQPTLEREALETRWDLPLLVAAGLLLLTSILLLLVG